MDIRVKPIVATASAAVLLSGFFSPAAQAQSTMIEAGTSTLADDFLANSGPEAVTVSWFVVENTVSDVYTYAYNVNNPVGDVEMTDNNLPTTTPETFTTFSVSFDTTLPGAFLSGTQPVGGTFQNNGTGGLTWTFSAVSPGSSSALLAFESALPPGLYNATVSGGNNPPSPWSTVPAGQPVPVPHAVPEPMMTSLFALTALLLLPFSSTWRRLLRQSWSNL